jgi:hypothetical protein
MTANKPLGNWWHKRNMTLTSDDLCSRVGLNTKLPFPSVYTPATYVTHGSLVPGLRHALGEAVKRPVGKCIVPVTLLHGTSVANLHFFIERLKPRFIEPVIQAFYRSLCWGVV